jgi:uncharacterized protein
MPLYFMESSAAVKRYAAESGSEWVRTLTDPASKEAIYVSRLTGVEVVAALARKRISHEVTADDASRAIESFLVDYRAQYEVIDADAGVINWAIELADRYGLRAYDAVQLASALEVQAAVVATGPEPLILVSADLQLNAAATTEGLTVDDPNDHP